MMPSFDPVREAEREKKKKKTCALMIFPLLILFGALPYKACPHKISSKAKVQS